MPAFFMEGPTLEYPQEDKKVKKAPEAPKAVSLKQGQGLRINGHVTEYNSNCSDPEMCRLAITVGAKSSHSGDKFYILVPSIIASDLMSQKVDIIIVPSEDE